ncbi:MAG: type IX secretion system sortase PorU [Cyclobacteriaceae bacterium]
MSKSFRYFAGLIAFLLGIVVSIAETQAQQPVFESGRWFKIGLTERGIYELDTDFFSNNLGINPSEVNPTTIRIFSDGNGGMLPQANSAARIPLSENAIIVTGESDGRFDSNDRVIFYGNSPDKHTYDAADQSLVYEKNLYSDTSFYFVNFNSEKGLRISSEAQSTATEPYNVTYIDDYVSYEKDINSIRNEGRKWYGYQMFTNSELSYDIDFGLSGITGNKPLIIKGVVLAVATSSTSFDLSVNDRNVDNISVAARPTGEFNSVGVERSFDYAIDPSILNNISNRLAVNLTYNPTDGLANGYLDYLLLQFARQPALYGDVTFFRSLESAAHQDARFTISTSPAVNEPLIWDVTDRTQPIMIETDNTGSALSFTTKTEKLREFVIFDSQKLLTPLSTAEITNQNLLGNTAIDGLIVTHPNFIEQAERLAEFHRTHDQLNVSVVTTEAIYNQFASGRQDISAIRDYARYLYDNGNQRLKYLLLFGDCSFDYKKRFPIDHNFVPVYQARESLHPIFSYSSDDYFGFLEDTEGEWIESDQGDHTLEIGVGRLPAKTTREAQIFVDKIIRYVSGTKSLGPWRNNIYFIADDGDSNIHQRDAERLSNQLESARSQFNTEKIYLDAFEQVINPSGERSPVTSDRIVEMIEEGALIVNYTGHGNTAVWTDERVFNKDDIQNLSNRNRLALFVTATCQFGKYDNPLENSGGEELLLNPNGGAIGLLTTTRPVFSNTNYVLNRAFYAAAFENGDLSQRLGDIIKITKNTSLRGSNNRNFALLGDPMMRLNVPEYSIDLQEVANLSNESDTISALSLIRLTGNIKNEAQLTASDFNGELTATVFDKPAVVRTLGNENTPFDYQVRNTLLFKGKASVESGNFSIDFIVPKNIAYNFEKGKISLYAINREGDADASGADTEVVIGGSASSIADDNTPPAISIFINDSTFRNGQTVGKDPLLLARLTDESGINISNRGFGQNLTGILNDTTLIDLNRYYTASKDTYRTGYITYPFRDLPKGKHRLKIKVWDIHNNLSESTVDFVVSENVDLKLSTVYNYPNPLSTQTTFVIDHDREGEELLVNLDIYSHSGQIVHSESYRFDNPDSRIDEISWDGNNSSGSPLANGVYIYKIKVQSTFDGATNEIFRRLVISK